MKGKHLLLLALILTMILVSTGCSRNKAATEDDVMLAIAAYQYVKADVQTQLPVPNTAVFAHFTEDAVVVEELDAKQLAITSEVAHRLQYDSEEIVVDTFTAVITYLGEGRYRTESIDFH